MQSSVCMGLPCWLSGRESTRDAEDPGDAGSIPGWGTSPGGGKQQPTPGFLPGEPHGQRSLVGYRPQGRKESDTTEQLSN